MKQEWSTAGDRKIIQKVFRFLSSKSSNKNKDDCANEDSESYSCPLKAQFASYPSDWET